MVAMLSRVVAFALAVVVLCFGFASSGQAAPQLCFGNPQAERLEQIAQLVPAEGNAWFDGSRQSQSDSQVPADEAAQVHVEAASDMPALMVARLNAGDPTLTMSRPRPYTPAAWRAPYLDGPQRPPCATLVAA